MTQPLDHLQRSFQARLLGDGSDISAHLTDGGPFMKVYQHAYVARQQEIIAEQFPALLVLLGDEQFAKATANYVHAHTPTRRSARWIGEHLADWLASDAEWSTQPVATDMATLEWALAHAFDAPDADILTMDDFAKVPPTVWPMLTFGFHPAVQVVELSHDVAPFQAAVAADKDPDQAPVAFDAQTSFAIWRDAKTLVVQYRSLDAGEALALQSARQGSTFTEICEAVADIDEENAAGMAAGYLRNWVETGLLSDVDAEGISWQR